MRTSLLGPLAALVSAFLLAAGCGPSLVVKSGEVNLSDVHLATIGRMYAAAEQSLGRPPKSADELKPFAAPGTDLRQLLVSPNDNQPYVVVWGTRLGGGDQTMVVAYERAGADGYRHVLTPSGTLMLTAEDFAKAKFPPGHTPVGR